MGAKDPTPPDDTAATLEIKVLGSDLYTRWNMRFNSIQRAQSYHSLTIYKVNVRPPWPSSPFARSLEFTRGLAQARSPLRGGGTRLRGVSRGLVCSCLCLLGQ